MSDRLKDLQRQRALAQEQLAWLDREIARESGATPLPAPTPAAPPTAGPAHAEADAEAMMAQYRSNPQALHSHVKRGCLLYFVGALALLALALLAFYFLRSHG